MQNVWSGTNAPGILGHELEVLLKPRPPVLDLGQGEGEELLGREGWQCGGVELAFQLVVEDVELAVTNHAVPHTVDVEDVALWRRRKKKEKNKLKNKIYLLFDHNCQGLACFSNFSVPWG